MRARHQDPNGWTKSEFERFYAAHAPGVGRMLANVLRDRHLAEDVAQEAFEACWAARSQLRAAESPAALVYRIARNRALNTIRTNDRRAAREQRVATDRSLHADASNDGSRSSILDLLELHLDPEERLLVVLAYAESFSAPELGVIFDAKPGTIRMRLHRASRKLAVPLADARDDAHVAVGMRRRS